MSESLARPASVVDLQDVRRRRLDFTQVGRERFLAQRIAAGLSTREFAEHLSSLLGWPVKPEQVSAWESVAPPPTDVLCAAEEVARPYAAGRAPEGTAVGTRMRLVDSYGEVQAALAEVVDSAGEYLAVTGSRSRDPDYMTRIETTLASRPGLVHYRVLYGPPRHGALKNHLLRLLDLQRAPGTLNISISRDLYEVSERFMCVSDSLAVIVLPSLNSVHNFDTALLLDDPGVASGYVDHVRQAHNGAEPLATRASIESLEVLR